MRDASDEMAVRNGCRFDEGRGQWAVDWMHDYLVLYEGECAGQPFECVDDWQYDVTMRMFGWVYDSEEWGKTIRRFRNCIVFIAKKNKKSPTLAAWAIYTAFGDGEIGQKVFMTAKNGNQIRENVGRHIHEMIRQSPQLSSECELNKLTKQVYHPPSKSLIMPLASENVQSQKALEGLNGSVFVDEVHVVDKAHMSRISRAGISRAEPLQVEVSTAGNDPDSYGMGRFKYAENIISGDAKDWQTLAAVYAPPQETKPEEIHADPLKYGRMANPAFGHTVKETEFMQDYERSKGTIADFAEFCMYRLNIWQHAVNPWLSIHDWRSCKATDKEIKTDQIVYGGLDLSRTTDFTAFVLYTNDPKPKCWGHYWCPKQRGIELSHQFEIPILDWADQGWVTLTEDRVIDRETIHDYLESVASDYKNLEVIGYDPWNADETVKFCQDNLNLEMLEIRQGAPSLNSPSKHLEELVVSGTLDHSNDPVLEWMLQNTSVKLDENGNIKPVKSVDKVRKHIDGIVALIMAICAQQVAPEQVVSAYGEEGML